MENNLKNKDENAIFTALLSQYAETLLHSAFTYMMYSVTP